VGCAAVLPSSLLLLLLLQALGAVRLAECQLMLQWGTDGWLGQVEVTWLSV
jgi:hypothetical protein